MDTIYRGNAAEAAVLHRLALAGIHVLVPFGGGLPFDLGGALPPDGRFVRIQVKSGRIRDGCVRFNSCSTDHGMGRQSYEGRADLIAVHVKETDSVYIVPVEDCPSFSGFLRLHPTRNNQRRRIRFAAEHSFERWLEQMFQALSEPDADRPPLRHPHAQGRPPPSG